jgi:hypothetical protein
MIFVRYYCTPPQTDYLSKHSAQSNVSWESDDMKRINETSTWRCTICPPVANLDAPNALPRVQAPNFHWVPAPTYPYLSLTGRQFRVPQVHPSTFFFHVSVASLVRMHAPRVQRVPLLFSTLFFNSFDFSFPFSPAYSTRTNLH